MSLQKAGANSALLIIDVQEGLFHKSHPVYRASQLLANICALAEKGRAAGAPVVFIQHCNNQLVEGSPDWQLHLQLQPAAGDLQVIKHHASAFEDTGLEALLDERGVGTLVVTGLVTHGCVRYTCQDARQRGYQVILVQDGHSSYSDKAAQLIDEWHLKLSTAEVELRAAAEITW